MSPRPVASSQKHGGDRPFKCLHPGCGATFAWEISLKGHHRTHTGEKSFACEVCDRKFAYKASRPKNGRGRGEERTGENSPARERERATSPLSFFAFRSDGSLRLLSIHQVDWKRHLLKHEKSGEYTFPPQQLEKKARKADIEEFVSPP